jgi:NAD(P)H-dependent flavin oxidoreductase YrpB (nitropropane dioxygenase family)
VATGYEGGGHQSYEKVGSMVLLQQIAQKYPNLPRIACGGYATGEGLAAALSTGAGAIAMGSRFIGSIESEFHENYKALVPVGKASDTVVKTGMLGTIRLWNNKYAEHHDLVTSKEEKIAQEKERYSNIELYIEDAKKYELAYNGNVEDGAVLIGQSIGIVDKLEHVSDIMERIVRDAEESLKKANTLIE